MEVKKRRSFTKEFKVQAIELYQTTGSFTEVARQLGISEAAIRHWNKKFGSTGISKPSDKIAQSIQEAEELRRLRKENEELKKANYILKRAAAFFSQDLLK